MTRGANIGMYHKSYLSLGKFMNSLTLKICRRIIFSLTEAAAACEAGLQAVIVDRSIEQEGGIELDEEVRKNFPVIDNLNELFGEEDEDDEEFAQVKYKTKVTDKKEKRDCLGIIFRT